MTLEDITETLAKLKNVPEIKFPYGAFVSPATYAHLIKICLTQNPPSLPPPQTWIKPFFYGMEFFPLSGVPDGEMWKRSKTGEVDLNGNT